MTFKRAQPDSLPFKGRVGEGMVFESPFRRLRNNTIPTQTLPLKGRASKRAFVGGVR
jgi:hypothetical protein